jgi:hypothetical protein
MQDIRNQRKAERQFYQRDELQQCSVCGRLFVRGKGNVCSMACKAKEGQGGPAVSGASS